MNIYHINDIAIKNKYTKWYNQIIQNALLRTELPTYSENHHIIPDCFYIKRSRPGNVGWVEGNPNDKSNLIRLTAKEHFVSHLLLTKMFEKNTNAYNKMIRAFHALSCKSSNQNQYMTGKKYVTIKQELSKIVSNQMKGKNSAKCPLTNRKLGRIPLSDPRWANGKIINAGKRKSKTGFHHTAATKQKLREARLNQTNVGRAWTKTIFTEQRRQEFIEKAKANYNRPGIEELKMLIKEFKSSMKFKRITHNTTNFSSLINTLHHEYSTIFNLIIPIPLTVNGIYHMKNDIIKQVCPVRNWHIVASVEYIASKIKELQFYIECLKNLREKESSQYCNRTSLFSC